jgi:hypothetical protein
MDSPLDAQFTTVDVSVSLYAKPPIGGHCITHMQQECRHVDEHPADPVSYVRAPEVYHIIVCIVEAGNILEVQ